MTEETAAVEQEASANLAEVVAVEEREPSRDEQGRFAPSKDRELSARVDAESYRTAILRDQAIKAGLVEPDDSMPPDEWKRAFEARQKAHADGSAATPVEPEPEAADGDDEPQMARDREMLDTYHQRRASFESQHPDFNQKVSGLELAEGISRSVQVAILEEPRGPEVAYFLAEHPEVCEKLGEMSAGRAVAEVGKIAERLGQRDQGYDDWAHQHLNVAIAPAVVSAYMEKAARMNKESPLSEEETGIARAVGVAPFVSHAIIAMGRPDVTRHLIQNPATAGELNAMHPLAAAGKLQSIADELDRESESAKAQRRRATPIMPTTRSTPTQSGLNDSLSTEEWARRFRRKMRYE